MNINQITFGKTFISKTPVRNLQTGKREMFDFVQYDEKKDIETVEKTSENWKKNSFGGGIYAGYIAEHMKGNIPQNKDDVRYFGIEDKQGNIQAVCEVDFDQTGFLKEKRKVIEDIIYMETNPTNAHGVRHRKYSGLGVSIVSRLIDFAKKENAEKIELIDSSDGFWEKVPFFEETKLKDIIFLKRKNYDECLKKLDEMI